MTLVAQELPANTWSRFPLPNGPDYRDGVTATFEGAEVLGVPDLLAKGFSTVPDWLMERDDVPPGAKLVYARIITLLNMGRGFPHQAELARKVGLKERQVRNHLYLLQNMGLLRCSRVNRLAGNSYKGLDNTWLHEFGTTSGKKLPVRAASNCRSERQSAASPSEEESKSEKSLSSFGGERPVALRSTSSGPAGADLFRDAQPQSQNSAADALRQEEDLMVDDDDRLAKTRIAMAQQTARTRVSLLLREEKKTTKRQKALGDNKFFSSILALEATWHFVTSRRFAKWGKSEYGIIGDLLKRFEVQSAEEEVAAALRFAVRHEAALIVHLVGPKKQVSLSLSFLHRNAETWLMLSKHWRKYQATWDKVDAWRVKHPSEYASLPYDLEQEYDEARNAFGVTGFKI
jgi:hypothetical protein